MAGPMASESSIEGPCDEKPMDKLYKVLLYGEQWSFMDSAMAHFSNRGVADFVGPVRKNYWRPLPSLAQP